MNDIKQIPLSDAWPTELVSCGYHGEFCPAAFYNTVEEWLEDGCPYCMAEVVGLDWS